MLVGGTFRGIVKAWKQVVSSDVFLVRRRFPSFELDGGHAWFSWLKNYSKSPFLVRAAKQSLFIDESCCCAFEVFFLKESSKKETLFLNEICYSFHTLYEPLSNICVALCLS